MIAKGFSLDELAREAFSNLRGQGRRSLLALLGVVIGSAAIVALMNIAYIAQATTLKSFQQTGVDVLSIQLEAPGGRGIDIPGLKALVAGDADALMAAPYAATTGMVAAGSRIQSATVAGITPMMEQVAHLPLEQGRRLEAIDACSRVAVVGNKLASGLSSPGAAIVPGQVIHIGAYGYTVVGVLKAVAYQSLSPIPYDDAVLIPLECARQVMPGDGATGALVRLRTTADSAAAVDRYTAALSTPQAPVRVQDARSMIETMKKQMSLLGGVLIAIGSISLLVGGVGVMNVMLMTVMERRREIGLRAAIGATPNEIRMMFLIEAILLTVAGGLLGDVLGVLLTWVATLFLPFDFGVNWMVLFLGAGVAAGVGLIFGLYPAISASRISPIEALRGD